MTLDTLPEVITFRHLSLQVSLCPRHMIHENRIGY